MIKKLSITLLMVGFISTSLAAQSVHLEFSYQTFRPFIHFQLNLGNSYNYYQNPYDTAYLKGYMDGVNDAFYNDYLFYDLVRDINMYEAGYRDGYRDRDLMIRLRGYDWYYRHRFTYDDYHSPYYSVQIWLGGLSLAFLHLPEHRLPRHWKRHAHPLFVKYRHWHKHRHLYNDRDYRHFVRIERDYDKRIRRFRKQAHKERKRYQKQRGRNGYRTGRIEQFSKVDKRQARQRVRQNPHVERNRSGTLQNSRRNRAIGITKGKDSSNRRFGTQSRSRVDRDRATRNNRNTKVKRNTERKRKAIRSNSRSKKNSKSTVRKQRSRKNSRGSVKRDRGAKKTKSRSRSRGNSKQDN
ncbi:MAG: hypothetical protein R3220_06490 [Balneolaceae bacterium]|nr:hypothetical protein [Balneolaceae bacterium]